MDYIKNWFSNFEPYNEPLYFEGVSYITPEHFFQAMKTLDPAERRKIANAETPGKAKRLGRKVTLRPNWEEIKVAVMSEALEHRMNDAEWVAKLKNSFPDPIVEVNNWHDNIWGDCICGRPACQEPGQNALGILLMGLRSELF